MLNTTLKLFAVSYTKPVIEQIFKFFNILTMDYLGTHFLRDFNLTFKTRILVDYSKLKAFLKQALVVKHSILI